ncbi:MAG TPA: hypothetical protein VFV58_03685 [Blastocatellia bacterium]|jgi:hypothetical protein|nr:hypothetical protein [Blastocatellia bacterium]
MYTIPRCYTLDGVAEISQLLEGVTLMTLEACDTIHVRTRNSDYEILMLDPESGRAMVRGGEHFTEPVEATVSGSNFGGCMLKMGWLGVGLRMEICVNGQRTVTSPVQSLRVEHVDFGSDQFESAENEFAELSASRDH